jgi:hypothetical protein
MPRLSDYPQTDAAVRRCFATADMAIVTRVVEAAARAYLSVEQPKIPEPTDADYAAAVEQAWSESKNQTSAALFFTTVPAVIQTWALHGRRAAKSRDSPTSAAAKTKQELQAERWDRA